MSFKTPHRIHARINNLDIALIAAKKETIVAKLDGNYFLITMTQNQNFLNSATDNIHNVT